MNGISLKTLIKWYKHIVKDYLSLLESGSFEQDYLLGQISLLEQLICCVLPYKKRRACTFVHRAAQKIQDEFDKRIL